MRAVGVRRAARGQARCRGALNSVRATARQRGRAESHPRTVIATLEPDALSAERSDSRSVPAFLAAFFVTELVFEAADSAGSVLATSALIMEMLLCVLSTKCFRESTSSSLRPNLARLDSTILIVSSRSCRSHSMERKPDSSSDLVHSYSSLSFPVADLRISFHRLCNSWTTVSEC